MSPSRRDSGYYDGSLEPIAIVGMGMVLSDPNAEIRILLTFEKHVAWAKALTLRQPCGTPWSIES